jgi:hypothetical protein
MCLQCKENERKLLVERQIDQQTAAKKYALSSSKGDIKIKNEDTNDDFI